MDKAELLALAERVEGLTEPDREVDAHMALATGKFFLAEPRYPGAVRMYGYIDSDGSRVEPGNGGQYNLIPAYTASLDAAMTLVPEGWSISMHLSENGHYPCVKMGRSYPTNATIAQEGPTLPVTICIAALRAHASAMEGEG